MAPIYLNLNKCFTLWCTLDNRRLTILPKNAPNVSSELASARNKIQFIIETAYGASIKKPLSLEATIGLGTILVEIDQELEAIQKKLGYDAE